MSRHIRRKANTRRRQLTRFNRDRAMRLGNVRSSGLMKDVEGMSTNVDNFFYFVNAFADDDMDGATPEKMYRYADEALRYCETIAERFIDNVRGQRKLLDDYFGI